MKLLTITQETQKWRSNDFCFGEEGEIAVFAFECDSDRDDVDGSCGCRRALGGIKSLKGSTTMKVRNIEITSRQLKNKLKEYFVQAGYSKLLKSGQLIEMIGLYQKDLERLAAQFPEGAVVEKRGNEFRHRKEGAWTPTK